MEKTIKALCDYLLGYWEYELDEDEVDDALFNEYFISKYGVDLEKELNISYQYSWKGVHIELSSLLDEKNCELSQLLLEVVSVSSSKTNQNVKRIHTLLEDLYTKI